MVDKTMLVFSRANGYDQFVGDVPSIEDFVKALTEDDPTMGWEVLEALADKLVGPWTPHEIWSGGNEEKPCTTWTRSGNDDTYTATEDLDCCRWWDVGGCGGPPSVHEVATIEEAKAAIDAALLAAGKVLVGGAVTDEGNETDD